MSVTTLSLRPFKVTGDLWTKMLGLFYIQRREIPLFSIGDISEHGILETAQPQLICQ